MAAPVPENLIELFDRVPPCLCRLMARDTHGPGRGRRSLSHHDLARLTGLGKSKIGTLSNKATWKGEKIEVIEAFSKACGVNLMKPYLVRGFMTHKRKTHIFTAKGLRKQLFARLFRTLNESTAEPE